MKIKKNFGKCCAECEEKEEIVRDEYLVGSVGEQNHGISSEQFFVQVLSFDARNECGTGPM